MQIGRRDVWVGWGDTDPAVIVYYPRYFRWFDDSTLLLFEQAGLPVNELGEQYGISAIPVVDAGAVFLRPTRFGDRFIIESHIANWSSKSFRISHKVMKDGELAVDGHEVRVWASQHPDDPDRFITTPIPRAVRDLFDN